MIRISDVKPVVNGGGTTKREVSKPKKALGATKSVAIADQKSTAALESLLTDAAKNDAASVHIEPHDATVRVRYRVDGLLRDGKDMAAELLPALVAHVKNLANLDTDEDRVPQDGRYQTQIGDRKVVIRASILPVADGEKVVLHINDQAHEPHDLQRLGYWGHSLLALTDAAEQNQGLVLVGGPAGSGKSATMYALLHTVAHPTRNLAAVEDTIEHRIPGISQTPVNTKAGMTFASTVRAVLQQDPNVLMISDVHEPEVTGMAVQAALAGRLVVAGIAARDIAATVGHIVAMHVEPYLFASAGRAVVNQRLVRRLCTQCKESYKPPADAFAAACAATGLNVEGAVSHLEALEQAAAAEFGVKVKPGSVTKGTVTRLWRAKAGGCEACGGAGYKGRIVVVEVLTVSPAVQKLIFSHAPGDVLYDQAIKEGMVPLPLDGFVKAALGLTSLDEVVRVSA
jgi:type IV pilus assembly protein PilB